MWLDVRQSLQEVHSDVSSTMMVQRATILHLSHGSIRDDARVCKISVATAEIANEVRAIGVGARLWRGATACHAPDLIDDIDLWSRKLGRWSPRIAAYFGLVEMTLRMAFCGLRMRPSIVHCHDYMVLPAAWLVSMASRSAVVYDAHELESERNGMSARESQLCIKIERWCWRRVSLLVSVSPSILKWYSDNLGPKRSVLVLNSPVLPTPAPGEVARERRAFGELGYFHRRFGIPAGTPVFIYVGLMVRGRGIEPVLEVFRRPGLRSHVVFMGYGDTVGVADHAERFSNIHLHPAVPHDQVVQFVREADCGICLIEDVSLSDRLCLPNKLFEYAFAGVPVLASRLPEIARVVGEYRLGICCDNDADSIEAAVRKMECNGSEPPAGDLTELSWETQAMRLQAAYRALLAERDSVVPGIEGLH